jgi:hypothetical protein
MSDTPLQDDQDLTVAITFVDAAGNPVPDAIDAGSLTATFADGSALSAAIGSDNASVVVTALGPLTTDDVLSVSCTVSGAAFSGTLAFDVGAGPATAMVLTPGTPEENTPPATA